MKKMAIWVLVTALPGLLALPATSPATDTDGGSDCSRFSLSDWGDAPEGVPAYPGVIGKFPTCRATDQVGTQEIEGGCAPISTFPQVTGHMFHRRGQSDIPAYWMGCHFDSTGNPIGIDNEAEGKMNQPAVGVSFCDGSVTDCTEPSFGMSWDQDEAYGSTDAGLSAPPSLVACQPANILFTTYNCASQPQVVYLNVLVDMNHDGDWNDVVSCDKTGACAYEWAVKNEVTAIPAGCATLGTPGFLVGPDPGPAWLRISLTDEPVNDDYPWAGAAGTQGYIGGETEDYPVTIHGAVPALPSTWSRIKVLYP